MMPRTTGGAVGRGLGQGEPKKAKKNLERNIHAGSNE